MKYMKKLLCLALVCAMCSQICGVTGEATETTNWKITDNPDLPPDESIHQWSSDLISYDTVAKFSITRLPAGVVVNYRVTRGGLLKADQNFSYKVSDYPVSLTKGRVFTHTVKYVQYASSPTVVKGNIVH